MTEIITRERIIAMSHISRWRGWTTRPYSVGEHTAIGAFAADWFKRQREQCRRWWLHDFHETEIIGDVPTPDKKAYANADYYVAVEEFDMRLGIEAECSEFVWWNDIGVKAIDRKMLLVENDLITLRKDPDLPAPNYDDAMQKLMKDLITNATFSTSDRVVEYWNKEAWKYGWREV